MTENSLHSSLKEFLRLPGDEIECPVDQFIIDIARGSTLYEIQVKNFYSLKPKLSRLLPEYQMHVVFPIARQKRIRRIESTGEISRPRKSPKHGTVFHVFDQLIYLTDFLLHPNLTIDVCMVEQEDTWINDGKGSWRRKRWSLSDQKLLKVLEIKTFSTAEDYLRLIPEEMPAVFTNMDLSKSARIKLSLARKMTYTLSKAGLLVESGKINRSKLFCFSTQVEANFPETRAAGQ